MKPYLLILMRNDLDSMSAGRAAAMASHATSAFTVRAEQAVFHPMDAIQSEDSVVRSLLMGTPGQTYIDWRQETPQFFGTAIVVGVTGHELRYYHEMAKAFDYMTEIINDPTYGVKDGNVTHFLPLDTCGYVFVNKESMFLSWSKKLPLF